MKLICIYLKYQNFLLHVQLKYRLFMTLVRLSDIQTLVNFLNYCKIYILYWRSLLCSLILNDTIRIKFELLQAQKNSEILWSVSNKNL